MPKSTDIYPPLTAEEFGSNAVHNGIPLVEDESADYVIAFGHIDQTAMAAAVNAYDVKDNGVDPEDAVYTEGDVEHVYAVTERPADHPEGWWIRWSSPDGVRLTVDTPHAFAVTVVSR